MSPKPAYIPLKSAEDDHDDGMVAMEYERSFKQPSPGSWARRHRMPLISILSFALGLTAFKITVWLFTGNGQSGSADEASTISAAAAAVQLLEPAVGWPAHFNLTNPLDWVNGPATNSLRENLKTGINYLTGWSPDGMTNVWMGYINLIYLATITDRVPVVPPFTPHGSHLGSSNIPILNFGELYDIPRLSVALRSPILEWSDVKRAAYGQPMSAKTPFPEGSVVDTIGCWSIGGASRGAKGYPPMYPQLQGPLQLDIAFTSLKEDILFKVDNYHARFWSVAAVLVPDGRDLALKTGKLPVYPAPTSKATPEPEAQFACVDNTFNLGASKGYEWFEDIGAAWRLVGRHTRFTQRLQRIADGYLRRALKVRENEPIPPFAIMHMRRGDFGGGDCSVAKKGKSCYPPHSVYAEHLQEALASLKTRYANTPGSPLAGDITKVIVTSGERNQTFWKEVTRRGWLSIDHDAEKTVEKYGYWYPSVLDSVIQSRAVAIVGTEHSTMSNVASWRVKEWNGGVSVMVPLGRGQADKRSEYTEELSW